MRTIEVKGWAVVQPQVRLIDSMPVAFVYSQHLNAMIYAVFPIKEYAEQYSEKLNSGGNFGTKVVECVTTFEIPDRRRKERP